MSTHPCPSCGKSVRDGARFCGVCRAAQPATGAPTPSSAPLSPTQRVPFSPPSIPASPTQPIGAPGVPGTAGMLGSVVISRKTIIATLAGLAGGLVASALLAFIIGAIINNEGAFILVGPLVGMGANLLPDMLKTAWVKVVSGGRQFEISLDKPVIAFGSSDDPRQADVGLYGDRGIAPRHFLVERKNEGFALTPLPQTGPVLINGAQVQKTRSLQPGDMIMVGQAQIAFYAKAG
jgi:hypothetical protein